MPGEKRPCLRGRDLTKVFGFGRTRTVAVDHVDFAFHEGEVISIVGESGSGKTALAKMLLGLINPTEGDVCFEGKKRDIRTQKKKREYWRQIPVDLSGPVQFIQHISGVFDILIASSSADIRHRLTVTLESTLGLPCLLDWDSTMRQWLADPRGKAVFGPFYPQVGEQIRKMFGGDDGGEDTIGMDVIDMLGDMPLVTVLM